MDLSHFRTQFPEFRAVPDSMVQAYLDASALEIDLDMWGPKADQGQGYLTAHKLAMSPWGNGVRIQTKGGEKSTYLDVYRDLQLQVSGGGCLVL